MVRPTTCPICREAVPATAARDSEFFPFCSERCRSVDLLKWSQGDYAIVEPLDPEQVDYPFDSDPDHAD